MMPNQAKGYTMKKLMLSASIVATLALSGCGGSDAPANNGSTDGTVANAKLASYSIYGDFEKYVVIKSGFNIDAGIAYQKDLALLTVGGYQLTPSDINTVAPYHLTQSGLHTPDPKEYPNLGYKYVWITKSSDTEIAGATYNLEGLKDRVVSVKRVKVDLSGQSITAPVLFGASYATGTAKPAVITALNAATLKFPAGAICYRDSAYTSTQDSLQLGSVPLVNTTFDQWSSAQKAQGAKVTINTWAGVKWAESESDGDSIYVVVRDGKVYPAYFDAAGTESVDSYIAMLEAEIALNPINVKDLQAELAASKARCSDFNEVAAKAVDAALVAGVAQ